MLQLTISHNELLIHLKLLPFSKGIKFKVNIYNFVEHKISLIRQSDSSSINAYGCVPGHLEPSIEKVR